MFDGAQKVASNCASAGFAPPGAGRAATPANKVIARYVVVDFNAATPIGFPAHASLYHQMEPLIAATVSRVKPIRSSPRHENLCRHLAVATLALVAASPADAKGCLKGAVVGGVAGHYAGHHGMLGAIAGCAYGRHEANQKDRQRTSSARPRRRPGRRNCKALVFFRRHIPLSVMAGLDPAIHVFPPTKQDADTRRQVVLRK